MSPAVDQIWREKREAVRGRGGRLVRIVRIDPGYVLARNCDPRGYMHGRTNQIKAETFPRYYELEAELLAVRRCRKCGCSDDDCSGCVKRTGAPCHWVEPDLCSACV